MEKNNWDNDKKVEREAAEFLNKYVYSNPELFKEYIRTDGLDEQRSGSDVLLTTVDGKLNRSIVDEKVASDYANKILNSFALELSSLGRYGKENIGWFLDKNKKTEYFLLGWIIWADIPKIGENEYDTNKITREKIKIFEWVLVKKSDIINYLESKGWTLERLLRQNNKIRRKKGVERYDYIDGITFRYTFRKPEKPINVLLKKDIYISISTLHGIIKI